MSKFNRLFIAEKKSAGEALGMYLAKKGGVAYEPSAAYAKVGNDYVAWMSGHLLELVDAPYYDPKYEKWDLAYLPIIPSPFVLVPKRDPKSRAGDKIKTIRALVADCTTVVGFGDPDAEGQLLQDELLIFIGNKKPVIRLWTNSLDDSGLEKALSSMKPNSEYIGWYEAARARSESDWLYGINMTIACALHAQRIGADFKISIGRVQTPTLNLIVERELDIRNFKPIKYYVPYIGLASDPAFKATWLTIKAEDGSYDDPRVDPEGRITNRAESDAIVSSARAAGKATVVHADTKAGTESAPLPFSLSALQAFCSKTYNLSAKVTLEIAQSLYLKKLTSYPRVDCDYLPESQHQEAPRILASLAKASLPTVLGSAIRGTKPALKSKAWNDSKVTAHHAIIPTHLDNPPDLSSLNEIESKVYFEIVKRYVLQFWPVAKFLATEVVLTCGVDSQEELFSANGRRYTDQGWRAAFTIEKTEDDDDAKKVSLSLLPSLTVGQVLQLTEAAATEAETKSPKRYNDGTLVTAMKNIHQYVQNPEYKKRLKEGAGIGTEATRGQIIDKLLQRKFVTMKGKDFVPSEGAMQLMAALPDIMRKPDMTAMWQQLNDDVMSRKSTYADFIAKQVPWLTNLVKASASFFNANSFPGQTAQPRFQETEKVCFGLVGQKGCGSRLRLVRGKYGLFFGCTNEACKKTFREVDGEPVEKQPSVESESPDAQRYACAACQKGFLRLRARRDNSGNFWGCSNWMAGCKAIFNDLNGAPDFEGKSKSGGSGGSGVRAPAAAGPRRGSRGRPSSYSTPTPAPR